MKPLNDAQHLYITNLLCEMLPMHMTTDLAIEQLLLNPTGPYVALQMILSKVIRDQIAQCQADGLADLKQALTDEITKAFTSDVFEPLIVLNLRPYTRTLIITVSEGMDDTHVKALLLEGFNRLTKALLDKHLGSITGCFGNPVAHLSQLGRSYKEALLLQDYHYVIGLNQCAFMDCLNIKSEDSMIEYKYMNLFQNAMEQEDFSTIASLLPKIQETLKTNFVKDDKTAYLYKELFALTIRHFIEAFSQHKKAIAALNEGINFFEARFDAIYDMDQFYRQAMAQMLETKTDHHHPYVRKTLHHIHGHYMEPISLNAMADALKISPAYLSRLFKQEVGQNYKSYLTHYRFTIAKARLETTDEDMTTIAHAIGYPTANQMMRQFKLQEGLAPSEYRQRFRS